MMIQRGIGCSERVFPLRVVDDPLRDEPDWDLVLPDEEEPYPEPGDFWIHDDDWEDAA